jgi:hypothetical protein
MVDSIRFMPQKGAKPRTMTLKRGIVDKPGRLLALLFQSSGNRSCGTLEAGLQVGSNHEEPTVTSWWGPVD